MITTDTQLATTEACLMQFRASLAEAERWLKLAKASRDAAASMVEELEEEVVAYRAKKEEKA